MVRMHPPESTLTNPHVFRETLNNEDGVLVYEIGNLGSEKDS